MLLDLTSDFNIETTRTKLEGIPPLRTRLGGSEGAAAAGRMGETLILEGRRVR
jgi:hypothetical protein